MLLLDSLICSIGSAAAANLVWPKARLVITEVCHKRYEILHNKLAFGQTRFAAAADPIEKISEEKFLLQIFAKMANL